MGRASVYMLAVFGATMQALIFPGPEATDAVVTPTNAQSPRPTRPPIFKELRRRQASSTDETFLVAPDNTCGYVSGLSSAYYTCNGETDLCVFMTATGSLPGAVGCCDTTDCGFRVTCYDYDQMSSSSLCDSDCLTNTFYAKCTDTTAKFCNTISFDGDIIDYFCNSRNISVPMVASTTYSGETDGRSFRELVLIGSSSIPLTTPSSSTETSTTTSSSSSSSTSSIIASTTTAASSGGGGSSTPVGAIVGGVVGGLAVLGLLLFGIFFVLRSNKKKAQQPPAQPQQPSYPPMAQQPPPPPNHASYYSGQPDPSKMGQQVPYAQNYVSPTPPSAPQFGTSPNQYPQGYQGGYFVPGQEGMQQQGQYPPGVVPGQASDPTGNTSPLSDGHRISQLPSSPVSTAPSYQQFYPGQTGLQHAQQSPVYEAGGNVVGASDYNANHRGQMHEMGQ